MDKVGIDTDQAALANHGNTLKRPSHLPKSNDPIWQNPCSLGSIRNLFTTNQIKPLIHTKRGELVVLHAVCKSSQLLWSWQIKKMTALKAKRLLYGTKQTSLWSVYMQTPCPSLYCQRAERSQKTACSVMNKLCLKISMKMNAVNLRWSVRDCSTANIPAVGWLNRQEKNRRKDKCNASQLRKKIT